MALKAEDDIVKFSLCFLSLYSGGKQIFMTKGKTREKKRKRMDFLLFKFFFLRHSQFVRHVTGKDQDYLGGIPRLVVQISALTLKGPL